MRAAALFAWLLSAGCSPAPEAPRTLQEQAGALIESPDWAAESAEWAEALGFETVVADCNGKLARLLERRPVGENRCEFMLPINPGDALLVSRPLREQLPPFVSLLDREALEAYRLWATRPESVGLERVSETELRVEADLGPYDVILVREPFAAGWESAEPAAITPDPIGFTVVDPGKSGAFETTLRRMRGESREPSPLPVREVPRIRPEGVTAAPDYRQGPFQAGDHLVIFGEEFAPRASHVRLGERILDPTFTNRTQVNVRLPEDVVPGSYELRVQSDGVDSHPAAIEVLP